MEVLGRLGLTVSIVSFGITFNSNKSITPMAQGIVKHFFIIRLRDLQLRAEVQGFQALHPKP